MATNAPTNYCMFCGRQLAYEVVPRERPAGSPVVFGPTDWAELPHECPPGAIEKWWSEHLTTPEPFFKKVKT